MKSANVNQSLKALAAALMGATLMHGALAQYGSPAKAADKAPTTAQKAKETKAISEDDAKQIAVKQVPGKAVDVAIEKKLGANRYVVEVRPAAGGKEVDVVIDMVSGKVLSVEK
jgi:uncharacterized membrane protein YkoI